MTSRATWGKTGARPADVFTMAWMWVLQTFLMDRKWKPFVKVIVFTERDYFDAGGRLLIIDNQGLCPQVLL
jgi:hypothetical protein